MLLHRKLLLGLACVVVFGPLGWTTSYALRMHSEGYRRQVEAELTQFFELPTDVGRIRGRTFSSRSFEDVSIHLPDRREKVFYCAEAIWIEGEDDAKQPSNHLELYDGLLLLGSDRWQNDDYKQVFESGLGHDFEDLDLDRVTLDNFAISFQRGDFSADCQRASGTIDMRDPADGVAHLIADSLNGHPIRQGVQIDARFLPTNGVEISEFVLTLPEVPIACIGLHPLMGRDVTAGTFAGRVQYIRGSEGAMPEVWLSGDVADAELAELTASVPFGPFEGRFSVTIFGARVQNAVVTHLRGRGHIEEVALAPFAPVAGLDQLTGTASLTVDAADLALGHINRLRVHGAVSNVSLEEILHLWGQGRATGELSVRINNLDVADDTIRSGDVEITVLPPDDGPGTVDREMLLKIAQTLLDFEWPDALPRRFLPEQLEYEQIGVRLLIRDNRLRVLGTHGPDGDAIVTIRALGRPFTLLREPEGDYNLSPGLERLARRARGYRPDDVKDWLKSRMPAPTTSAPVNEL